MYNTVISLKPSVLHIINAQQINLKIFNLFILERESVSGQEGQRENERIFFFKCLFIFERETEWKWARDRERGRHRIWSRPHALSCQHKAPCRAWTHELQDRDLSQSQMLNWQSHPGAPEWENLKQAPCSVQSPTGGSTSRLRDHDLSQKQESDVQPTAPPRCLVNKYFKS